LTDDEIVSDNVRVRVERHGGEGIGVIEAPRGTLIHHYWADDVGKIIKANLIVATVGNNPAIDLGVNEVAKSLIKNGKVTEGMLNRVEMLIRCYDPCLSCATHTFGKHGYGFEIYSANGECLQRIGSDVR
jgi:NAD-reducing hydrogenase large subunit